MALASRAGAAGPILMLVLAIGLAACGDSGADPDAGTREDGADGAASCEPPSIPDGGPVTITGSVVELVEGGPPRPLAGAMVSAEYGGLYLPYCDLSRGSPHYLFGAITDQDGNFTMEARHGVLGLHAFASGYYYNRALLDTASGTSRMLTMTRLEVPGRSPVASGAGFDRTRVAPGGSLTFSATVAAGQLGGPLSDEVLLVEPTGSWTLELDPPSAGRKDDFPDGLWSRTFAAPTTPGTYTYHFVATAATCETAAVQTFDVTVD